MEKKKFTEQIDEKEQTLEERLMDGFSEHPSLGNAAFVKSLVEMENENNLKKRVKTNKDIDLNKIPELPMFGHSGEDLAKTLSDAGIKAAKATHKFNMMEIKAKLIADLCVKLTEYPMNYSEIPIQAREIADKALENL